MVITSGVGVKTPLKWQWLTQRTPVFFKDLAGNPHPGAKGHEHRQLKDEAKG